MLITNKNDIKFGCSNCENAINLLKGKSCPEDVAAAYVKKCTEIYNPKRGTDATVRQTHFEKAQVLFEYLNLHANKVAKVLTKQNNQIRN